MHFIVYKETGNLDVLLLRHKGTNTFSFVNLTKGHICSCIFSSIEEAILDLEERKKQKLLIDYKCLDSSVGQSV